jgi:hypothetical protein
VRMKEAKKQLRELRFAKLQDLPGGAWPARSEMIHSAKVTTVPKRDHRWNSENVAHELNAFLWSKGVIERIQQLTKKGDTIRGTIRGAPLEARNSKYKMLDW